MYQLYSSHHLQSYMSSLNDFHLSIMLFICFSLLPGREKSPFFWKKIINPLTIFHPMPYHTSSPIIAFPPSSNTQPFSSNLTLDLLNPQEHDFFFGFVFKPRYKGQTNGPEVSFLQRFHRSVLLEGHTLLSDVLAGVSAIF